LPKCCTLPPLEGIVLREEHMTGEDRQLAESLQAAKAAHFDVDGAACDYAALAASRERGRLAACLADLEKFDPKRVRIPAQTAFWVNVFNAGVLRDVPELELAASLGEVQAFFERPRLNFGGERGVLEFVLTRLEDEAAVDLVDRRRGRVKLQYAAFDWALNRREASDGNRS